VSAAHFLRESEACHLSAQQHLALLCDVLFARLPLLSRKCNAAYPLAVVLCPAAVSAAHFLRESEACHLSASQHLALLSQLLDDCLDTSLIRDMLSNRCEQQNAPSYSITDAR
jgi:hypothetical protein